MTKLVNISSDFGIVIRCRALRERSLPLESIARAMEASPLDQSDELLSFGPHFGGEAAAEFGRRLEGLGLVYVEDFFVFDGLYPPWISFFAGFAPGDD